MDWQADFESYYRDHAVKFVNKKHKGKENKYALCSYCDKLQHASSLGSGCPIFDKLVEVAYDKAVTLVVWECAEFKERELDY